MNPLVVIPARGGSKGIPRKNIKPLNGKPLIYYTIEAAREVFDDEVICVSTDDEEIKQVVEQTGLRVPFLRPAELATDTAGTDEVLAHALGYYKNNGYQADIIVLLQPTSPFRNGEHIRDALELFHSDLDKVVSVKETDSNPYYVLFEENEKGYLEKVKKGSFSGRQECPTVYELNGAIYIINVSNYQEKGFKNLDKIRKYVMKNFFSLDIDSQIEWEFAEFLMKKWT